MALLHYLWSRTAASNATADAAVNWAEGQAPSSVNDSARAMMASAAGFRDDISGAIVTGGTSTAYTVTSYQVFNSLANMSGQIIAFTPHATNGATVTLNVDGLGAKPLRSSPSVELNAGTLVLGTPYTALYNNSDAVWYLSSFYGNAYNIPLAGAMPFFGSTAPNSSFVFPYGQAISRTTYSALFALVSTTYGAGDTLTTFNLPDLRGRVIAGKDDMGGSAASRLGANGISGGATTLGNSGGAQDKTLVTANLPAYTPTGTLSMTGNVGTTATQFNATTGTAALTGSTANVGTFTGTAQGGTSTAFQVVQPTIIGNYIMRII